MDALTSVTTVRPTPQLTYGCIWLTNVCESGHAGAMLQARRLGKELYVGVHSDQAILENKGPTVMSLDERLALQRILSYLLFIPTADP